MAEHAAPLPLFSSHKLGTISSKDGREFTLVMGLDEDLAAQLKERSLDVSDTELMENTSDKKRFGDGSYEEWYAKERFPFALVDTEGKLAALMWFGPANTPDNAGGEWDTIAWRSYPPYRGAGLMRVFSDRVLAEHEHMFPERRLWLETHVGNQPALALYRKVGFVERGLIDNGTRVYMVKE